MLFDKTFLILIPALLLAVYAQWKVRSTYSKYASVEASSRLTAAQVARYILDRASFAALPAAEGSKTQKVKIEAVPGVLSDHYDPRTRTLRLSNPHSRSLADIGVAAHEAGHALQHAEGYGPLSLRSTIVPVANFGSQLAIPLFLAGLIFRMPPLITVGILAYSLAVLFTLVTLPVEFNASRRAIRLLQDGGFVQSKEELSAVKQVLGAAALTYVAAAAVAVLQLIQLLIISRRR